jgi:hypothetical protein
MKARLDFAKLNKALDKVEKKKLYNKANKDSDEEMMGGVGML